MRMQRMIRSVYVGILVVVGANSALAQHVDPSPRAEAGKIVLDGYDDDAGMVVETNVSVFGFDFQEDPMDPFFIQDPGFNAQGGSGLPVDGRFGFDIVNGSEFGLVGNANYWNGTGPVSFGSLPSGVSLNLAFGPQSVAALNAAGPQSGFFFGPAIGLNGTFHEHLGSTLGGATLVNHDGIYLIGLRLKVDSDGANPLVGDLFSDPIWIVYNNGLSEAVHDEAIDWTNANLVPEPSSFALASIACVGYVTVWRRRRRLAGR